MLMSYAVAHSNGRFFLPRRVREWLQLPRDCRLHGRLVDDTGEPAIILSPIPLRSWTNCFSVIVNTSEAAGSLYAALDAIEHSGLSIRHMVAAAASAAGHLTVTAIVSQTDKSRHKSFSPRNVALRLERSLKQKLQNCASGSDLFATPKLTGLKAVRVTPLLVLRALAELPLRKKGFLRSKCGENHVTDFSFNLKHGAVDLKKIPILESNGTPSARHSLFSMLNYPDAHKSVSLVITADPDDYHFRVAMLPARASRAIDVPLHVTSKDESSMMGLTKEIVGAFRDDRCPINIYFSSSSVVEAKPPSDRAEEKAGFRPNQQWEERLTIRLVGDTSAIDDGEGEQTTANRIVQAIERERNCIAKGKGIISLGKGAAGRPGIKVQPLLAPLVFTATNVKPSMPYEHVMVALALFGMLKDLHLRPVFVPTLTGAASARGQMTSLLKTCPMLISLYLPEPEMRLGSEPTKWAKRGASHRGLQTHSPSSWTTFEEAYMTSMRGRNVHRILHEEVFSPPFVEETRVLVYRGLDEGVGVIRRLRDRVEACMDTSMWREALRECGENLSLQGVDIERIDRSDPESWLIEGLERLGRWRKGELISDEQWNAAKRRQKSSARSTRSLKPTKIRGKRTEAGSDQREASSRPGIPS